jgi:hypothetical protein
MRFTSELVTASFLALAIAQPASATTTLLTTNPGTGTTTTFTTTGLNGNGNPGPVIINGFTVTGNPQVVYGDNPYGLGTNGAWTNFSWVATNNADGSITFDLGANYDFVGAFMNYSPGEGTPTIAALNSSFGMLGTYDLAALASISTPGADDGGAFRGIQSSDGDIRYFVLSNSFILAHNLTLGQASTAAVPEPSTWAMMLVGFGAVGFSMRRARRAKAIPKPA